MIYINLCYLKKNAHSMDEIKNTVPTGKILEIGFYMNLQKFTTQTNYYIVP